MASKAAPQSILPRLPRQLTTVRHDLESAARQAWDEAIDLLPSGTRKAVQRFARDLTRRQTGVQQRLERTRSDAGTRAARVFSALIHRAESTVAPIVHRFDIASRAEVDRLRKRVTALERRAPTPTGPSAVV